MKIDDKTVDKIASLSKLSFSGEQKEALKNAPKKDSTYFKIPKVLTR